MVTMAKYSEQDEIWIEQYATDADLCGCGHDRGSHWDSTGSCGYCGCQSFAFGTCLSCIGTLTHMPDCLENGAGL